MAACLYKYTKYSITKMEAGIKKNRRKKKKEGRQRERGRMGKKEKRKKGSLESYFLLLFLPSVW